VALFRKVAIRQEGNPPAIWRVHRIFIFTRAEGHFARLAPSSGDEPDFGPVRLLQDNGEGLAIRRPRGGIHGPRASLVLSVLATTALEGTDPIRLFQSVENGGLLAVSLAKP
jgi:hypothetical protein